MLDEEIKKPTRKQLLPQAAIDFYNEYRRLPEDRLVVQEKYNTKFMLDKDYEIVDCIGQGAYGIVAAVRDKRTDDFFAVKKVAEIGQGGVLVLKRTLREIRILRHLSHENV
jgi:serine/threonine protein kinase